MRALAVLVAAAACGGGGGGAATPKKPKLVAVDEKQAEKDARGLVDEIYSTLTRGNKDNLFSVLDNTLVVFGPRRTDAFGSRADTLIALGEKKKLSLKSNGADVVASIGGHSAVAVDIVSVDGEPHAVLAILVNADDLWQVDAASIAAMPARSALKAELDKAAVVPTGATAKVKMAADAKPAVERFQKGLLEQELWGADLEILVGPLAGEMSRNKKDIKGLWKKRVAAKTRAAVSGEIAAGTTIDGQLAWVSAPITRVAEGEPPLPLRAFAVFEKAGADWKLIALHESLAFAEPGAGTPFVKILPPKEKEPPPPPVEKKPEKKPEKVAKKTAAKKKPVADDSDETPKKKTKKKPVADDSDDAPPKKKLKKKPVADDDDPPPKKTKKKPVTDDDSPPPKKTQKKKPISDDDDAPPKKTKKKKPISDDDADDDAPKPKKKKKHTDDDDE